MIFCLFFSSFFPIVSKRHLIFFQSNFFNIWYKKHFHSIFSIQHLSGMLKIHLKLSTFTSHFRVASWCIQTKTFLIIHSDVFFACSRIWCDEFGKIGCRNSGIALKLMAIFHLFRGKKNNLYLVWLCWKFSDVTINIFVATLSSSNSSLAQHTLYLQSQKCISACLQ